MSTAARPSFADQQGWGWQALQSALEAVPWLREDAHARAHEATTQILARAASVVRSTSEQRGMELGRAVRNLVPEAPLEDLPLWRLLLDSASSWTPDEQGLLQAYVAELPPAPEDRRIVEHLVGRAAFTAEDLARFLSPDSNKAREYELGIELRRRGQQSAASLVTYVLEATEGARDRYRLQLIKRAAYLYPPSSPLTLDDVRSLEHGSPEGRRDAALLARWPHLIRALEGQPPLSDAAHRPKGRTEPLGIAGILQQEREERINAVIDAGIQAIAERTLSSGRIHALATIPKLRSWPTDLEAKLRDAIARPLPKSLPKSTPAYVPGLLRRMPAWARPVVAFLLASTRDRIDFLVRATPEDRVLALGKLDRSELIATLASPDLSDGDRRVLVGAIVEAERDDDVLGGIVSADLDPHEASVAAALPERAFADWLEVASVGDRWRHEVLVRALDWIGPDARALEALAEADLSVLPSGPLEALLLDAEHCRGFQDLDPERWAGLYARFASLLSARGWLEPLTQAGTRLDAALAVFPDITITQLAGSGALLEPAIVDRVPLDKLLTWLTTSGAVRRWQDIVDLATTKGTVLPPRLVEAALARPGFLESALQAEPSVAPLEPLLQEALVSRSIAAVVDRYVPPATRWPVLPWVRERYAGRPGQAAANELAVAFGLSYAGYLRHLASMVRPPYDPADRGRHFDHLYRTHSQPKRSGGTREICVPDRAMRGLQRAMLGAGFDEVPLHAAATGFRRGVSIRDNAAAHVGQPMVINIDIEAFFPSTRYELVLRACRSLCDGGLSPAAVRLAADICTFRGALPTGAPTSPAIANLVLRHVDAALTTAAARRGVAYTRYADDLTFSGDEGALRMVPFARRLLRELGYELDRKKTNVYRRGRRQIVTGLVVNERADVPRRTRRRLRAALHRRETGRVPEWHGKPLSDGALQGWFAFLAMLRPSDGADGLARLRAVSDQQRGPQVGHEAATEIDGPRPAS